MPETNVSLDTLENLCINSIVEKLDRFRTAFQLKENGNFQLYLEFLQKWYSDKILQQLVERNLMKDEYLHIVINKYTKVLDFRSILHCDFQAVLDSLEKFGHVIQKFNMISIKPFYCYDDVWRYLTNVQFIDLQYTNCSDESIIRISDHCPHLKSLNLGCCIKISDKGLVHLGKKSPPLEFLNLTSTTATFRGVSCVLKNISSIKTLWFDNVPRAIFEALGLNDAIGKIPNDITFNLTNIMIVNKPMRPKAHLTTTLKLCQSLCPFIEDLTVTEILNDEQVNLCSLFKRLKKVNLQCSLSLSNPLDINDFLKIRGENIHTLVLMNFSFSLQILLNSCPNVKILTLEYPMFENFSATNSVKTLSHLKSFNLHNTILSAEENTKSIFSIISSSPKLEEINFRVCENLDEIYDAILNYPSQLKVLSFGTSAVEASFIEDVLRKHNSLIEVHLDNSGITMEEYDDLMDIVDEMEKHVTIGWTDYHQAIRELYSTDYMLSRNRQILKL